MSTEYLRNVEFKYCKKEDSEAWVGCVDANFACGIDHKSIY